MDKNVRFKIIDERRRIDRIVLPLDVGGGKGLISVEERTYESPTIVVAAPENKNVQTICVSNYRYQNKDM